MIRFVRLAAIVSPAARALALPAVAGVAAAPFRLRRDAEDLRILAGRD
jgi:hypothetical protein